jgi:hypothetical protein
MYTTVIISSMNETLVFFLNFKTILKLLVYKPKWFSNKDLNIKKMKKITLLK